MSDLCPQCGNPAYLPSDQCNVVWHTGAKPFGTSVAQDIDAQLAEQIEWVKRLADDLIAAEGREARLEAKLAQQDDLVQAAVAAALREAAALANTVGTTAADFSALITPDAQAALDRVVAAERERCARVADECQRQNGPLSKKGFNEDYRRGLEAAGQAIAAAIRASTEGEG